VPYAPHAKGGLHLVDAIREQACAVVGDIFVVLRFHKAWLKRRLATATKVLVLDLDDAGFIELRHRAIRKHLVRAPRVSISNTA
jgi:hypothetical protein